MPDLDDDTPRYSDADVTDSFAAVTDQLDFYEDERAREAFVTAAMAMHMHLTHGQLPGRFAVAQATDE